MSSLIAMPFRPVLNQKGQFEAGATITVYKQGTQILEPLYEDVELTQLIGNPVTADGFGVFPPIYWDDTNPIRVKINQSNGETLFDIDPYISTAFEAEEILSQAVSYLDEAAQEANSAAESAATCSAIEATVQALVGPTYASTAEGLAATTSGEFFPVVVGDVVSIYLNNAGSAVLQRSILSSTAVQDALDDKADLVHTHVISDVTGLQTALDAKAPLASPSLTGTPTVGGLEIGTRKVPRRTTTTTAVVGDNGGCVALSANITIPNSVFEEGHAVSFYNNSASSVTLIQGAGMTLRLAGTTTTGTRTLEPRGMATIWFNSASEGIVSGPGVT